MSDSPGMGAGTASTSVNQWTRIGGVLVERDDLIKAIGALSALPDSGTIIIKSLNPDPPVGFGDWLGKWAAGAL